MRRGKAFRMWAIFLFATAVFCWSITDSKGSCFPLLSKDRGKGWLGISVQEVPHKYQRRYHLDRHEGVYVTDVAPDSPAEEAGIEEDDIILKYNGTKIKESSHLRRLVRRSEVGKTVELKILREGESKIVKVTIGKQPRWWNKGYFFEYPHRGGFVIFFDGDAYLGVSLQDLNKDLAKYFGVSKDAGVLVVEVEEDGPADEAGLKAGDIITEIDGEKIHCSKDVRHILRDYDPGDEVEIKVYRDRQLKTFTVELGKGRFRYYRRYRREPWEFYFSPPYFDFDWDRHFHFYWWDGQQYIWLENQPWYKRLHCQLENELYRLKLQLKLLRFHLQRECKQLIAEISNFVYHEKFRHFSQFIENRNS